VDLSLTGGWLPIAVEVVAVGERTKAFKGTGAFIGPCPWGCGAWLSRAFRLIKPGQVKACRADEWDGRVAAA